jgi:hypothetical protein
MSKQENCQTSGDCVLMTPSDLWHSEASSSSSSSSSSSLMMIVMMMLVSYGILCCQGDDGGDDAVSWVMVMIQRFTICAI